MHGFKKTVGGAPVQILAVVEPQVSFGCIVSATGVTAGDDGRKIVKAGTPLTGDLTERETAFQAYAKSGDATKVVGVLLHDVDVTDGDENGTCLVFGWVNKDYVDAAVLDLWDEGAISALKAKVTLVKSN